MFVGELLMDFEFAIPCLLRTPAVKKPPIKERAHSNFVCLSSS